MTTKLNISGYYLAGKVTKGKKKIYLLKKEVNNKVVELQNKNTQE